MEINTQQKDCLVRFFAVSLIASLSLAYLNQSLVISPILAFVAFSNIEFFFYSNCNKNKSINNKLKLVFGENGNIITKHTVYLRKPLTIVIYLQKAQNQGIQSILHTSKTLIPRHLVFRIKNKKKNRNFID